MIDDQACANTDRELWRERQGDYYANSIHLTQGGGIGINVGGSVIVKSLHQWHEMATKFDAVLATLRIAQAPPLPDEPDHGHAPAAFVDYTNRARAATPDPHTAAQDWARRNGLGDPR